MEFTPYTREQYQGNRSYLGVRVTRTMVGLPIRMAKKLKSMQWTHAKIAVDKENKAIQITKGEDGEPYSYKIGWQHIYCQNLGEVIPEGRYLYSDELSTEDTIVVTRR